MSSRKHRHGHRDRRGGARRPAALGEARGEWEGRPEPLGAALAVPVTQLRRLEAGSPHSTLWDGLDAWRFAEALMSAASIVVGLLSGCASSPQRARVDAHPELRLGLRITGDEVPLNAYEFVLYDTGLVITKRRRPDRLYEFLSVKLSQEEAAQLLDELRLNEFFALEEFYNLAEATSDLPT